MAKFCDGTIGLLDTGIFALNSVAKTDEVPGPWKLFPDVWRAF